MGEKRIHGVTEEERLYLRQLTAASLPDSPRDFGMKAGQVKPKFWKALTEGKGSVVWLINRVIDDLNTVLGEAGSVYDLAVAYGFEGTEAEWLDSLKGEQGVGVSSADVLNNILVLGLTNGDALYAALNGMASTADLEEALAAARAYTDEELAEFDFVKIVDALPATGLPNRIYLVPKADTQTRDLFDEYLWVNGAWEWIDTKQVTVDLTGYVQAEEGKGLSTNDLTDALKANYDAAYTHSLSTHAVSKGGTGRTTHTSNSVLTGNGTGAVKNVATKSGACYATETNGAPQFGTLPVEQGGTGGTTATAAVNNMKAALRDLIYPVGSIYLTMDTVDHSDFLGGTWVRISQGRYLVGVGGNEENTTSNHGATSAGMLTFSGAGEKGGAVGHTHGSDGTLFAALSYSTAQGGIVYNERQLTNSETVKYPDAGARDDKVVLASAYAGGQSFKTNYATNVYGDTGYTKHLPPYFAVYIWQRTA